VRGGRPVVPVFLDLNIVRDLNFVPDLNIVRPSS
jgi:hypothetical protein